MRRSLALTAALFALLAAPALADDKLDAQAKDAQKGLKKFFQPIEQKVGAAGPQGQGKKELDKASQKISPKSKPKPKVVKRR